METRRQLLSQTCITPSQTCTHAPCRTHIFSDTVSLRDVQTSRTRMAQGVLQCACHISPSHILPSHVSLRHPCCSPTVTSTLRSCLHLPCRTVPRSLATWPIPRTPHGHEVNKKDDDVAEKLPDSCSTHPPRLQESECLKEVCCAHS